MDIWNLSNLFPAGTVHIEIVPNEKLPWCEADSDGWFRYHCHHGCIKSRWNLKIPEDDSFCKGLDFLVQNNFISITYYVPSGGSSLFLRIYLIPFDLPGAGGKLRMRKDNILLPAKRYLSGLFLRISQNPYCWEGRAAHDHQPFVSLNTVRLNCRLSLRFY